jgi:uncharacterized Zn finger protein
MSKRVLGATVGVLAVLGVMTACGDSKSSGSSGSSSDAEFCAKVKAYRDQEDDFDQVMEEADAAGMKTMFNKMQDILQDLDDDAPAVIAADIRTVREVTDKLVEVFDKYDYDFVRLAAAPEFAELSEVMDGDKLTKATERLDKWGVETCGFEPEPASGS